MEIQVLFDSIASKENLAAGWGFSCLVDESIIFDTGENGDWLLNNIKQLSIDISKIKTVVISHDHWDHTGGLWKILELQKNLAVYACPGFTAEFKEKVKKSGGILFENSTLTEISENIFTTGEIQATYKKNPVPEQSLVIKTEKGISIITGCAHPGILEILENIRRSFQKEKIYLVMGGFHLIETDERIIEAIAMQLKKLQIRKIGPCHCSGNKAEEIFKRIFRKNFITVSAGSVIQV